ncbi:MAG: AAA family ATPase [Clostridia bacterium]|nr:AAA family ATPase [Clostridia bacterium]
MIIRKIQIDEFGGLKNVCIEPDKGINIIRGNNESGKSTLMAFIAFIFYGLPSKRSETDRTDRERALSWTGGKAAGTLEIEYCGSEYRINRSCVLGARDSVSEQRQIIDLATGTEVFEDRQPGEVFLGVSQAVFESVTTVRQMGVGRIAGSDLGSAVENILFSADETVNTERALKKLNAAKVQYLPQRGGGGRIEELTRARDILKDRLIKAETNSVYIISLRSTVDKYRKVTSELRYKLDSAKNACNAYDSFQTLNRFDLLHAGEKKIAELQSEEKKLIEESGTDGKLPDRAYVEKLDELARRLGKSESELAVTGAEVRGKQSEQSGDSVRAASAEDISAAGGASEILNVYRKKLGKSGRRTALGIIMLILGTVGASASLFYFVPALGKLIPKLTSGLSFGLTIAGIAVFIAGVLVLRSAGGIKKTASGLLSGYGFENDGNDRKKAAAFADYAEDCAREKALRDTWKKDFDTILTALDAKKRETEALRLECILELAKFGYCKSPDEVLNSHKEAPEAHGIRHRTQIRELTDAELFNEILGSEDLSEKLISAAGSASEIALKHEKLLSDIDKYSESVRASRASLAGFNEDEMRARLSSEVIAALKKSNPSALRLEREAIETQLNHAGSKLTEAEKNLAIAEHTYENPARLSTELDAAEDELDKAKRLCAAIMLAHKSISDAGDSLRRNITPRLRARAGEILSGLTGGKYREIGVDPSFAVTVATPAGTKQVALLSGGTRDIVYFSLRLALAELIFPKSVPPLLLDEAASQLDDGRAAGLLKLLDTFSSGGVQSIFFSCHTREANILERNGIGFTLTELN